MLILPPDIIDALSGKVDFPVELLELGCLDNVGVAEMHGWTQGALKARRHRGTAPLSFSYMGQLWYPKAAIVEELAIATSSLNDAYRDKNQIVAGAPGSAAFARWGKI